MKKIYAAIFICMALILGICLILSFVDKKKIARYLRYPLAFALLPTIANIILMICRTQVESNLAYSIFYGSINWLLVSLLQFCIIYTGTSKAPKFLRWIFIVITAADSLSMFLNPVFGHAFLCNKIIGEDGNFYFIATGLLWFNIHLAWSYIVSLLCFVVLIIKLRNTAIVYWEKYIVVLCSLAAVIIWDAFFVANTDKIDRSIIGYAIGFSLLTYFTLIYKVKPLITRLLQETASSSPDMFLFFDADKQCVYANNSAETFFNLKKTSLDDSKKSLQSILRTELFPLASSGYKKTVSVNWDGQKKHFLVDFQKIQKRNRLEGYFYHLQDITAEVNQKEETQYRATHTPLTGLYNKQFLIEKTGQLLSENPDEQYYVVATDIKNFKLLNDLFGQETGDKVIIHIANTLNDHSLPNTLVGHLGADKFIQIVREADIEENISQFQKIFDPTSGLLKEHHYSIIVHAGIYKISKNDFSIINMFDRAFIALSSVKNNYENRVAYYDENMRKAMVWEQQIISELEEALNLGQFEVYLQPQTDKDCNIKGAEALVRWNHPEKGLLPPNQFIKTFEKNGLISKLDLYMWDKAFQLLSKWKRIGKDDFYISVNLSPLDFYYLNVYDSFMELVKKYDVSPKNIHIEITETIMLSDLHLKLPIIERLHLAGFVFVMDDFGSGYSSLNILKDLPVDILKIDMGFLYHAKDVSKSKIIIRQLSDLAKKLGLSVATEGLETKNQLDFLIEAGCDSYQGYYFTIPIPVKDFEEKYF